MGSFVMLSLATERLDGFRWCWFAKFCYVITRNGAAGRFEESGGMGSFVMLSLATEWLDGLRRVLVWEVLLCYH